MFDLGHRLALVTGGGRGIGAGIAAHLARRGARVLVNDLVAERAEATAAAIRDEGGRAEPLPFDVTDRAAVETALRPHPIDVVVNNAANAGAEPLRPTPFRETDPSRWDAPIRVNLYGVLHTTHAVLPGMCERRFGRLVTIASGAGVVGLPIGVATYGAAKAGAISFMRHVALETAASGITANSVALGLMEMAETTDSALVERLAATIPCGRLGTGDDVGAACVWLASDEAGWVTGQTLQVNGGSVTS